MKFIYSISEPKIKSETSYWFAFKNNELLVNTINGSPIIPMINSLEDIGLEPVRRQYLGTYNEIDCYSAELDSDVKLSSDFKLMNLRSLIGQIDEEIFLIAGKAFQIKNWDANNQFCGRCGAKLNIKNNERAKECPQCSLIIYPRISPAVIVAIVNDGKILLANSRRFNSDFYSVLAGFVEAGETFEECVAREIREEVNIEVKNVKYFGNQPWPFPDSLMVAFTAEYSSGVITPDGEEIIDAQWFSANSLPNLPGKWSIARRLVEWFVTNNLQN
jgi:NAD+ diphosphatase